MVGPMSALEGRVRDGAVSIRDCGLRGMITLKGDLSDTGLREASTRLTGLDFPQKGGAISDGDRGLLWMAPDELLILTERDAAAEALAQLSGDLTGTHHLAVDVSDARALMGVEGESVREVLARVTPADLHPGALPTGVLRRTKIGQVAGAFWLSDADRAVVICFRSVAGYVFDLLANAADSPDVGHLPAG